jgi:hypothetical protein
MATIRQAASHEPEALDAQWYLSLHAPDGASCCSMNKDCEPVADYRASADPGGYEAKWHGEWIKVPATAVLKRADNPTGRAVVCVLYLDGNPVARCFVTPAEG